MNWDRVETNWRPLKSKFKEQWSTLTDSQLEMIAGKRERLIAVLQENYGLSRDEVERQVGEWERSERRASAFEQALRSAGAFV